MTIYKGLSYHDSIELFDRESVDLVYQDKDVTDVRRDYKR